MVRAQRYAARRVANLDFGDILPALIAVGSCRLRRPSGITNSTPPKLDH